MTKLQTWILRKIFAKLFIQGPEHQLNAARVFQLMREVWQEEFTEDNSITTDEVLREAFEATTTRPCVVNETAVHLMKQLAMDDGVEFV